MDIKISVCFITCFELGKPTDIMSAAIKGHFVRWWLPCLWYMVSACSVMRWPTREGRHEGAGHISNKPQLLCCVRHLRFADKYIGHHLHNTNLVITGGWLIILSCLVTLRFIVICMSAPERKRKRMGPSLPRCAWQSCVAVIMTFIVLQAAFSTRYFKMCFLFSFILWRVGNMTIIILNQILRTYHWICMQPSTYIVQCLVVRWWIGIG